MTSAASTIRIELTLPFIRIPLVPYSQRLPVVQPFVHALFGGATMSRAGVSDNAFAMFVGGGLDIGLRKGIGLRLVQADWLMTQFREETQNRQGRVSAGLVIKF